MKRIGIVAAAVLPMVVAAVAPAATAGQRIDRVGFLVAGLLAGFGLTRLTGWLDPDVVGRAAGRVAEHPAGDDTAEAVDAAVPVERPVLFDHAAVDEPATVDATAPSETDAATGPAAEPAPAQVAEAAAAAAPAKGKRKKSSKAARATAPAEPAAASVPAEPVEPTEPAVAAVADPSSAPVAEAAAPAGSTVEPTVTDAGPDDAVDGSVEAAVETPAETPADEVDPVDIVGIAARTLASQLAPGTRIAANALSALDTGRAPARNAPAAKPADKPRPATDQPATAPVRGAAPATAPARGRQVDTTVADDERAGEARPGGDDARVDAAGVAGTAEAPETSVVELLAKRAASTGAGVWSLAMNGGGGGGPASWALAPNAEAARKAAEEAVREALDNAGRAEADPSADAADRGTSPIVGRVPRRDR